MRRGARRSLRGVQRSTALGGASEKHTCRAHHHSYLLVHCQVPSPPPPTPLMVSLPRVLVAFACLAAALSLSASAATPSAFELSTVYPLEGTLDWVADQWSIDLSTAGDNDLVHARLTGGEFAHLQHQARDAASWRTDSAVRVLGLRSIFWLRHGDQPAPQFWSYMQPANSSTFVMPLMNMASEATCLQYDDKVNNFYAVAATQKGTSNVYTITIWYINEWGQYGLIKSLDVTRNDVPSGEQPLITHCAYNDALATLSVHFPGSLADATPPAPHQGTLLTFNISTDLNWKINCDLLDATAWPEQVHPPLGPTGATLEVKGLATDRSMEGLLAFVRTQDVAGKGTFSTLGWMDVTGREVRTYLSMEVGQYASPLVRYNRATKQLVVFEQAAPFRYTAVWQDGSQPMQQGNIQFDTPQQGYVVFGAYAIDS